MTAQHFRALADSLRHERAEPEGFSDPDRRLDDEYDQWRACVVACYQFNGRFDRERPYRAAGLDS
jgi:hypothetical protein